LFASFQYDKEMGNNGGPRPGIDEDQGDFHEAFFDISLMGGIGLEGSKITKITPSE
jgi:hypothetical protein